MERLAALYGYRPIQTPVFEDTELFLRTSGQGSDVVQKEMYTFADRSDRSLTLRPEGTAPICRAYVEHGLHREPQPQKLYTIGSMYRYGAPGRGRYREHWQLSLEAIGADDPAVDAEIVQLYDTLLRRLGIASYRLELNSIGCRECRPAYLEKLRAWLAEHDGELDADAREKAATSPLRVFDVKNVRTQALLADAPKIGESLCDACRTHFAAVRADLDATGVRYELVPTLVRGLDYYSRTTWEFVGPLDNENATLSGGGRYDYLVEEIGGPPTPGVGFGAGIERLLIAMEEEGVADAATPAIDIFIAVEPDAPSDLVAPLLKSLRDSSVAADTDYAGRSLKGQLTQAGTLRSRDDRDPPRSRRADPQGRRPGRTGQPCGRSRHTVAMIWRTHMCGEPAKELVGEQLTLSGWAARRRDHGGLIFVDLRDRTGITQLVINPELAPEAAELAHQIRNEFVLRAEGTLVARSAETVNPNMPTGEVELQVDTLEIVSRSTPLPFQLDEENVDETLRLRHRWLDLRRDKLQRNITLRAQMVGIIRREMEAAGFLDIQTPILFKPTPEGARDFVVPARLQQGRFYALPQSPQILKQLTMVAGFDRYYQIAICFRDEDLRADRVQEITQLDVEMSFPDQEFLYATMEQMYARIWRECLGIEIETPFPRMTFAEADRRFGTDKPDTRFELEDRGRDGSHPRARNSASSRAPTQFAFSVSHRRYSRGDLAKLEELAKEWGAKGLAYLVFDEEGEVRSPIAKFLSEAELSHFRSDPGSTVLFAADTWPATSRVLGALRSHLGRELGLIDEDAFTFLWVYDFPMFERDEDEGRWTAVHHPFTRPTKEWEPRFGEDPEHALAHTYDLIVNGNELGGGSFRIHEPEVQAQVFELLGLSEKEQRSKFGFLLDALAMGAPPMGGIALGIDRMTMVLAGEPNLRDVIAFPKNQAGVDPMSGAPSEVTQEQLDELGIRLLEPPT